MLLFRVCFILCIFFKIVQCFGNVSGLSGISAPIPSTTLVQPPILSRTKLCGIGYKEQNISAIVSRLYEEEYFCCSKQVILSRTFLLFQVGYYTEQKISTILSRLCRIEYFYHSKQVILGRTLFRLGYVEQNISTIMSRLNFLQT